MPFSAGDADRHKKGLEGDQRSRWASIANGVRKQCLDSGKSESECDGMAVRVANSKVGASRSEKESS